MSRNLGTNIFSFIVSAVCVLFMLLSLHENNRANGLEKALDVFMRENAGLHQEVQVTRNDAESLGSALEQLSDEHTHVSSLLANLRSKPADVRYLTRVETVLQAGEPVMVYQALPASYQHEIHGIPVAGFESDEDEYRFFTYDLTFRTTVAIGDKDSSALLQVASSRDHVWHEVPVELTVFDTGDKFPALRPTLHLGVGADSTDFSPSVVVAMPLIHVSESLDFLAPAVVVGKEIDAGLIVAAYNVGKPLPVVDDLWLGAGVSVGMEAKPSVLLTLSSEL